MKNVKEFEGDLVRNSPFRIVREKYARHFSRIHNTHEMRASIRAGAYAWPGGYPLYFVTDDGAALCFDCVRKEYRQISEAIKNRLRDGWRVMATDINYEKACFCAHCNKQIESAYDED